MENLTEKELNQLYFLNRETEQLQKDLQNIQSIDAYKSPIISDMPRGGIPKNFATYIAEKVDLEKLISLNLQKIQIERGRLERYISGVPDAEVRLIMRLRHINGMTWREIGDEINMDHTTAIRKYRAFLKVAPNAPS